MYHDALFTMIILCCFHGTDADGIYSVALHIYCQVGNSLHDTFAIIMVGVKRFEILMILSTLVLGTQKGQNIKDPA